MTTIDWYFDFVSPFSYLASESIERLPRDIELRPQPILFAGLLKHWSTKGPAEIGPMRRFTFQHVQWLADRAGIEIKFPPVHPFNPLNLLRLNIALDSDLAVAQRLFRFVWAEGGSSEDPAQWQALTAELGVNDVDARINADEVKAGLRRNTEEAIERGIFGVPSFVIDEQIFWGYDAMDFLLAYLDEPALLQSPAMRAVDAIHDPLADR